MRIVARGFFLGGRCFQLAATIFHSCAAGSQSINELRTGIREYWQGFAGGRDEIASGFFDWERSVADRWVRPGAAVLLAGVGTGRDLFPFLERGCRVTGVDPATEALDIARRELTARGVSATLVAGFVEESAPADRFDVVWFSNASYSLIPEMSRRAALLKRLAAQLNPEGVICVSHQSHLPRPRPVVIRAAQLVGALTRSDWRLEPGDLIGWKERDGRAFYSYAHAFVPGEIEREAALAGLRIADRVDGADQTAFVLQT